MSGSDVRRTPGTRTPWALLRAGALIVRPFPRRGHGCGDVPSHIPHLAGVDTVDVLLLPPHVAEGTLDPRISAGELLDERHPARGEGLYPLVRRVCASLHLGADVLHELGPLGLRLADPLLSDLAPPRFQILQLLRAVVLVKPLGHLDHLHDRLYEPLGRDLLPRAQPGCDLLQAVAEPSLQLDPLSEPRQVKLDHPPRSNVRSVQ